jgi:hypothetical protein
MKITFDIVSYYADIFCIKSAVAKTIQESSLYRDLYFAYIDSCGWSDKEFDAELLRRIDDNWDLMYN